MRTIAWSLLPLLLGACAGRPLAIRKDEDRPAPGTLVDADERPLSADALADLAGNARFILVGEGHDNACDHLVQATVIRALAPREPAVGLEMVEVDRQPILDRYRDVFLRELGEQLDWDDRWGVDFRIYEPIFQAASENELPLLALNLPRELVREVGRIGPEGLTPAERSMVPEIVPPPPEQEQMLRTAWKAHGAQMQQGGDEAFRRFAEVQALWDSQMASVAARWSYENDDRPVVILAGAGHVENGWGIEYRLRRFAPKAEVLSIAPWRADGSPDPRAADLFYYCPATEEEAAP